MSNTGIFAKSKEVNDLMRKLFGPEWVVLTNDPTFTTTEVYSRELKASTQSYDANYKLMIILEGYQSGLYPWYHPSLPTKEIEQLKHESDCIRSNRSVQQRFISFINIQESLENRQKNLQRNFESIGLRFIQLCYVLNIDPIEEIDRISLK